MPDISKLNLKAMDEVVGGGKDGLMGDDEDEDMVESFLRDDDDKEEEGGDYGEEEETREEQGGEDYVSESEGEDVDMLNMKSMKRSNFGKGTTDFDDGDVLGIIDVD